MERKAKADGFGKQSVLKRRGLEMTLRTVLALSSTSCPSTLLQVESKSHMVDGSVTIGQ